MPETGRTAASPPQLFLYIICILRPVFFPGFHALLLTFHDEFGKCDIGGFGFVRGKGKMDFVFQHVVAVQEAEQVLHIVFDHPGDFIAEVLKKLFFSRGRLTFGQVDFESLNQCI